MALPMQAGYAGRQSAGPTNNSGWSFFANNGLPALGAGLDTAALGIPSLLAGKQKQMNDQKTAMARNPLQGLTPGGFQDALTPKVQPAMGQPAMGANSQMTQPDQQNGMGNLADLLQNLIGHKTSQLMGNMGMPQQATNPQRWNQQASDAVQQQQSQEGPPEWNGQGGGFSFNEFLSENNPLQGLGDQGTGSQQAINPENKSGWRKAANVAGNIGSTVAKYGTPLATAAFGPVGLAAGGALGALSYLGKQA